MQEPVAATIPTPTPRAPRPPQQQQQQLAKMPISFKINRLILPTYWQWLQQ